MLLEYHRTKNGNFPSSINYFNRRLIISAKTFNCFFYYSSIERINKCNKIVLKPTTTYRNFNIIQFRPKHTQQSLVTSIKQDNNKTLVLTFNRFFYTCFFCGKNSSKLKSHYLIIERRREKINGNIEHKLISIERPSLERKIVEPITTRILFLLVFLKSPAVFRNHRSFYNTKKETTKPHLAELGNDM